MVKKIVITAKPSKSLSSDEKVKSQYRYIKELSLMKYRAEEQREQNLIQQSSQMQTGFSFMTAALFMALPVCIEHRGELSLTFFLVSSSIICTFLIASLVLASLAQWRWKMQSLPDIGTIRDFIVESDRWEELSIEQNQLAQCINLLGDVQRNRAVLNNRRVALIMASMVCFYLSIFSIIISFIVAIIIML